MAFLEWDEQYSTNVQQFDNDHKQLFIIFNGVYKRVDFKAYYGFIFTL